MNVKKTRSSKKIILKIAMSMTSIPSHSSPLLLLPLTILIPTIFATFLKVPLLSHDDPTLCSSLPHFSIFVFLSFYPLTILL